ncbi:ABC transporter ATP-binding protein [Labrys miyagiensis]|uniref:ABC transporter ATP-binding protein n=1 Tax=Labrys miyagiensis TaxID=346912 RepID=UPI0024E061F5|nr:ABC transporter ATP-binding protein [Labrys miyagiensis]
MRIDAQGLGFRYAAGLPWLFENLSFSLASGQTLVLLGRNGRGKTTLLKCLAKLITPTAGSVRCNGVMGYVPQQFTPPFSYSVFDVVLMGRARHVGVFSNPTSRDRARTQEALELIGLASFAKRPVTTLSGGERQLVLIARALAAEADILLLDEPTSALDFRNQALVLSTLRRLAAERQLTVIMTTHEPTHALEVADRAILLHGSGMGEEGSVASMCTESKLSELYGISMKRLDYHTGYHHSSSIVANYSSVKWT